MSLQRGNNNYAAAEVGRDCQGLPKISDVLEDGGFVGREKSGLSEGDEESQSQPAINLICLYIFINLLFSIQQYFRFNYLFL